MTDSERAMAEFLANGGKIQTIKQGVRAMSDRDLYLGTRDGPSREDVRASKFKQADRLTGGSLTDNQLLHMVEMAMCE